MAYQDQFGNVFDDYGTCIRRGGFPYTQNMTPSNTPPANGSYNYSNGLQQIQQTQQPQPQQSRPQPLNGRVVADPADIVPKEIPMDGSISFFPSQDLTYILAKQWNTNGAIDTVKYVPERPPQQEQPVQNEGIQKIMDKLNAMEEVINKLNKELNG